MNFRATLLLWQIVVVFHLMGIEFEIRKENEKEEFSSKPINFIFISLTQPNFGKT